MSYGLATRAQAPRWVRYLFVLSAAMGCAVFSNGADAPAGEISGFVRTSAGKPVRGSIVLHDLSTPRTAGNRPFDRQFGSRTDGSFRLNGVPAGLYEICVDAPHEAALDPCIWSPPAPTVRVQAGQVAAGVEITVQTGAVLRARLHDERKKPASAGAAASGGDVSLGIVTKSNLFVTMKTLSYDDLDQERYLVVPYDEPITMTARSANGVLSDRNRASYQGNSATMAIRVESGVTPEAVEFHVSDK